MTKKRKTILLILSALLISLTFFNLQKTKDFFKPIHRKTLELTGIDYWKISVDETENGGIVTLLSPEFNIDTIFRSMLGPAEVYTTSLIENKQPELLWITGYKVKVVNKDNSIAPDEFMCHNNLDYNSDLYYSRWNMPDRTNIFSVRLITLTTGQTGVSFPEGYAIPIMSDEKITVVSQVLNHNLPNPDIKVKHSTQIEYEKNNRKQLKPLMEKTIFVTRPVVNKIDEELMMSAIQSDCRPARSATLSHEGKDEKGNSYTGHWVIPKGFDTTTTDVTEMLNLPFSTTLHYAGVHVHPFAVSLTLIDVTADTVIFTATATNFPNKTGLQKIDFFSSEKGVILYRNHQYHLTAVTNNNTAEEQDMMAVMYLYLYDSELEKRLEF